MVRFALDVCARSSRAFLKSEGDTVAPRLVRRLLVLFYLLDTGPTVDSTVHRIGP